jgi:hypothetical protein
MSRISSAVPTAARRPRAHDLAVPALPDPARIDAARIDAAMAGFVTYVVSVATGVEAGKIFATTRHSAAAARARHVAMYLAHIGLAWPLTRVGAAFGRDRTTASHAVQRVEDLRDQPGFDAALEALEACVRAGPPPLVARGLAECD